MQLDFNSFNSIAFGRKYEGHWLENTNGIKAFVSNYGARLVALYTPDKSGEFADIVLGFNTLNEYMSGHPFFGVTVGRCANRIAKGKFDLEGETYQLNQNNYPNHLHGGPNGFHNRIWMIEEAEKQHVEMSFISPDGHEGYPGKLKTIVRYELNDNNQLKISYQAATDKTTIVNLTHHSYFNLKGEGQGDILDHQLKINGDYITPVNQHQVPDGHLKNVAGTPFDFSGFDAIGNRIKDCDEQMVIGHGFDINYVLNSRLHEFAADVYEPSCGRAMRVYTNQPGMQFYTGNFLDGSDIGKSGKRYYKYSGFCLETQHFPNAINEDDFPSVILKPEETYEYEVIYEFYTVN